ncbi:MAG: hypothetical protein WBW33_35930 [Bryobacteraceae bacterium]
MLKIDESLKDQPAAAELEHTNEELKPVDAEKIAGGGWHGKPDLRVDYWEHRLEQTVEEDQNIPETDREAIIRPRRG